MQIVTEYVRTNICIEIEYIEQMFMNAWGYYLWKSM